MANRSAIFSKNIPGLPVNIVDIDKYPGNVYFVDSGSGTDGAGYGQSPDSPLATLDYAIGLCTANNGDVIIVLPGHAEDVESAGATTADVAGVTIIGLGAGADRPKFTFKTDAAASMVISAASVKVKNIIGIAGVDSLTNPFNVTGDDVELDITWRDDSASVEATKAILLNGVDRGKVCLTYHGQTGGNACTHAVKMVDCSNVDVFIQFYGKASTAVVEFHTTASENINVRGYMYNSGTTDLSKSVVDTVTGSTWTVQAFDGAAGCSFSGGSGAALAKDDVSAVASLIGTLLNTGGTATLGGIIGDMKNIAIASTLMDGYKKTTIADGTTIPNNSQAAAGLLATANGGDILIEEIIWQRGATSFTTATNYEFTTDNVAGLTGVDAPVGVALSAKFAANNTGILSIDGTTKQLPFVLESTKKLYIHGDDNVTGAGGTTDFYIKYKRLAAGAALT